MPVPILSRLRQRPVLLSKDELLERAVKAARDPKLLDVEPRGSRDQVEQLTKAIQFGAGSGNAHTVRGAMNAKPSSAAIVAARAHQALGPSSSVTPVDIALAMQQQGLDWVEPFAPGQPLTPYYGYGRQPRSRDYKVGRNVTTQSREGRIPFHTLDQLFKSYDVAQIATRHAINSLRSMKVRFLPLDDWTKNPKKEIVEARKRLRRPDGQLSFKNWLAENMFSLYRFDSAPIYRNRDRAGRVTKLINIAAPTIGPMLDYYGNLPEDLAPAFQQYIQGVPWDWLTRADIIYEPFWPEAESPYGTPPLETILMNANTDLRLQLFFLQFFTSGAVPEALAIAPPDMTSGDDIADFEEQYYDYFHGDQSERWGLHWLPNGTELEFYKPQVFDPDLAEYVLSRTAAAFMMNSHDLGFTADVNRSSGSTQQDLTDRVADLPVKGYYEDILDSVIQEDWDLPVQIKFVPGGNEEDTLDRAQSFYFYWQMGAISSTEVREELGYSVDPEEKMPLGILDPRIGWIPAAHIIAVSGDVDPRTGMPKPDTITPQDYRLPAGDVPAPIAGPHPPVLPPEGPLVSATGVAPKGEPAKVDPTTPSSPARRNVANKEQMPDESSVASPPFPEIASGRADGYPGYGTFRGGSTAQGTAAGADAGDELEEAIERVDPKHTTYALKEATVGITASTGIAGVDGGNDEEDEREDLIRWQKLTRKAVAKGSTPRHFASSSIRPHVYDAAWSALEGATSVAQVRVAFDSAFKAADEPGVAGIAVRARDTGRILMLQRSLESV